MFWVVVIILVIVVIAYNSSKKKKARQSGQPGGQATGQAPNQAALRQGMEWLTHHPFTPQVLEFLRRPVEPRGQALSGLPAGRAPIASFVIHAGQDGTYETVYLRTALPLTAM